MELVDKILAGNVQAASRLIRGIEDEAPDAIEELNGIYPHTGRAYIVGVTGAPGAGKSTLVDNLISIFARGNMAVGVIAIDPTSPFTGGAILGDRIRMQQHSLGEDVFIRSLATRGWVGGLSKATLGTIHVMDAMGKGIILVETVGSGQIEIDIAKVADTTLLILTPGAGDDIQMMKAGILEVADIFVINKADRDGADNIKLELEIMLGMRTYHPGEHKPNIVLTEATSGKGADELADEILKHRDFLVSSGELEKRRKERAKEELIKAIEGLVRLYCYQRVEEGGYLEELVDEIARRKTNPHSAALKIIGQFGKYFK